MQQNEHRRRYEGSRSGNRSRNRSYDDPEREHGPNYYSGNEDQYGYASDYDSDYANDYERGSYSSPYGQNYREDRADYAFDRGRSNRNYRDDDDSFYTRQNNRQPHRGSRNYRAGTRGLGNRGGLYYPKWSRGYRTESEQGYGGGYYGGRQGWGSDYGVDDYYDQDDRSFLDKAGDEIRSWFGDEEAERRRMRDGHAGKGPKGYIRSDSRIAEDVNDYLTKDFFVDASNITVTVSDCEVTLDGTTNSKNAKRRAEDCADAVSGVKHVQNNLRVVQPSGQTDYMSGGSATNTHSTKSSKTH